MPKQPVAQNVPATMRTFLATLRPSRRPWRRYPRSSIGWLQTSTAAIAARLDAPHATPESAPAGSVPPGSQAGFMLIEVVVSALLVGLIAIGTLSGFESAGRARVDQRAHAQATQLIGQDEERLRGLTTTQLAQLGTAESHYETENGMCLEKPATAWLYYNKANTSFCEKTAFAGTTYTGLVFTITSSAEFVSATKEKLTCEVPAGTADYIRTKSTATWSSLGSRPPVTQSSIISTSSGARLLVKVENQAKEPVEGANVTAEGTSLSATETTPPAGCVVFGALNAQTDKISVAKSNWVDVNGKNPASKEYTVSAGTLGELAFKIAAPGTIAATFESNEIFTEAIKGVSFVAYQANITTPPSYFVKETAGGVPQHVAELTGLFPFAKLEGTWKPEPYTVYAGDCKKNEPSIVGATNRTAPVEPNLPSPVKVEVPAVNVTVYQRTKAEVEAGKKEVVTAPEYAMVINSECAGVTPVNAAKPVVFEHNVKLEALGHLEEPYRYQPYAKSLKFCVVANLGGTFYKYLSPAFENKVKAGTTIPSAYMKTASKPPEYENTKTAGKLKCP
jgi:type II secretory pathway pseudopilin PulG